MSQGILTDSEARLGRLAVESWKLDQPRTVTLRNLQLVDAAIRPVWQWQQVVSLDLSQNKLRVLPEDINFPNLTDLNISGNEIATLPTQLRL